MPASATALTTAELAAEVLRRLGEIDANEDPTAADAALILQHHQAAFNAWYLKGWAVWPFETTPFEALQGFGGVLVARVRPHFQGTSPLEVEAEERAAERAYFRDNPIATSQRAVRAEYF